MAGAMLREGVVMSEGLYLGGSVGEDGEIAGPYHLEAKDLRTHGVVVGMTGSGKTGLCLVMLEELARAGVPVIAIDPKGDLANLKLTFPKLEPVDFEPWIDPAEAARKDMSPADFAAHEANKWREGLASWDQDGDRIARLLATGNVNVYTPGSDAGRPAPICLTRRSSGSSAARSPAAAAPAAGPRRQHVLSGKTALISRWSLSPQPTPTQQQLPHLLNPIVYTIQ